MSFMASRGIRGLQAIPLWIVARVLTVAALAVLAGNAMFAGPRPLEFAGLAGAALGIALSAVAYSRNRR
ncbi:MAG: hypothetical protein ACRDGF_00255 [Chloroflexota bacterium]